MRVRWYGELGSGPEQLLFVENKLHRESWTGEKSVKVAAWQNGVLLRRSDINFTCLTLFYSIYFIGLPRFIPSNSKECTYICVLDCDLC